MTKQTVSQNSVNPALLIILLVIGFIWVRSSFGKVLGGEFVSNMQKTVGFFMSDNPYPVVKNLLQTVVLPNATLFGHLTMWGEMIVSLAIVGSAIFMLVSRKISKLTLSILIGGLVGGIMLNTIFWFSAGWTSPSTDSLNLLMLSIQLVGLAAVIQQYKKIGVM